MNHDIGVNSEAQLTLLVVGMQSVSVVVCPSVAAQVPYRGAPPDITLTDAQRRCREHVFGAGGSQVVFIRAPSGNSFPPSLSTRPLPNLSSLHPTGCLCV